MKYGQRYSFMCAKEGLKTWDARRCVCTCVCLPHQRKTAVEKEVSLLYCWCCVCLQDPGQTVYFPCRHCKLWQTSSLTDTQGRQTNWSTGGTKEQTQLCVIIARDKQQRKVKGKGKWEWYQSSSLLFRFRPQVHHFFKLYHTVTLH